MEGLQWKALMLSYSEPQEHRQQELKTSSSSTRRLIKVHHSTAYQGQKESSLNKRSMYST